MKTYVVNLEKSTDRKKYMTRLLADQPFLDVEFINAVDGRNLSPQETENQFDCEKFLKHYMAKVRPGEIGCTLSHQKCYRNLLESNEKSVIIFEDDLIINEDFSPVLPLVKQWLDCEEPRVLLLSGWFWHTSTKKFDSNHRLAQVVDGYLTHAYAINRAAAKIMVDDRPWYVADAWREFISRGVKICGLRPHIFDQDWSGVFKTVVNDEEVAITQHRLKRWISVKHRALRQKLLSLTGRFEPAKA